VIEVIEPRAFQNALDKVGNVAIWKDHNPDYVLAETRANNLSLYEDAIGLHADALITDEQTITEARAGKLKGWSFGMANIADKIEERAEALPLRRVSGFDLDHIALIVNKTPVYAATSIEMRANDEVSELEIRSIEDAPKVEENQEKPPEKVEKIDYSAYENRIKNLKSAK
jgi:HK97 family phage prohead protease